MTKNYYMGSCNKFVLYFSTSNKCPLQTISKIKALQSVKFNNLR